MSYNGPPQGPGYPNAPQQGLAQAPGVMGALVPATMGGSGVAIHWSNQTQFVIKRNFWSLFGRKFRVFTTDGTQIAFVKHPIFRWRPEFTIFADESETVPLLLVKGRSAIGFNIAHDIIDVASGQRVGCIRSRGLKSIFRDTWDLLDLQDQVIGLMQEDGSSFLRRLIPLLLGKWHAEIHSQTIVQVKQVFRFFTKEVAVDMSMGAGKIDAKLAIALGMFALMAESRRESGA